MRTEDDSIYIQTFGKFVQVVFIANSNKQANEFLEVNDDCGVLKTVGNLVFIANIHDLGFHEEEL